MSQRERRATPAPPMRELALLWVLGYGVAMLYGLHLARAIANWIAGAGFTLTPMAGLFAAAPGILRGDATAGLSPAPTGAASAASVHVWSVLVQVALLTLVIAAGVAWARRRPEVQGLASKDEVQRLHSVDQLRRVRHELRPDLYPRPRPLIDRLRPSGPRSPGGN